MGAEWRAPAESLSSSVADRAHPDDPERAAAAIRAIATGEPLKEFEGRLRCGDGVGGDRAEARSAGRRAAPALAVAARHGRGHARRWRGGRPRAAGLRP